MLGIGTEPQKRYAKDIRRNKNLLYLSMLQKGAGQQVQGSYVPLSPLLTHPTTGEASENDNHWALALYKKRPNGVEGGCDVASEQRRPQKDPRSDSPLSLTRKHLGLAKHGQDINVYCA